MMRQAVLRICAVIFAGVLATTLAGQGGHVASPPGVASTEIRGRFAGGAEAEYRGGKRIEVMYGRPIKRGRDLWGTGPAYGQMLNSGSPVWRAGANMSTRLKTELPLVINGKPVPIGEYSLFIELKPATWTLIVSRWGAQKDFNASDKNALWGSFDYTPEKDVVRASMKLETLAHSVDQLTWKFLDMSDA